jgi:hypothetical protein
MVLPWILSAHLQIVDYMTTQCNDSSLSYEACCCILCCSSVANMAPDALPSRCILAGSQQRGATIAQLPMNQEKRRYR